MADFQTPIKKIRGHGAAKEGVHHWWLQRLTALANIPLVIFLVVSLVGNLGQDLATWRAWLAQPIAAVLVSLFIASSFYHMRLGLQVLIEDYVRGAAKVALMVLLTFITVTAAAFGIFSVLSIAL